MTEVPAEDRQLLDLIKRRVTQFEQSWGQHYRDGLWERMDRLYHAWTDLKSTLADSNGDRRTGVLTDAQQVFGHELFIPYAFSVVETVLPRLLSNRPRMLVLPGDQASEKNVENMKALIDKQQSQIDYELKLQSIAKSGLIYGLGPAKTYWLRREGQQTKIVNASFVLRAMGQKYAKQTYPCRLFDDPVAEVIPVRDFGWDPLGANVETSRYMWHRTWRDTAYVKDRLADPNGWNRVKLTDEDLDGRGSAQLYRKSVQGQFDAQGIPLPSDTARDTDIHEVIEYHDGGSIVTVLDRNWIVSIVVNEAWWGRLPFQCYRPTEILNQMVGKGEIEPIEDLQREMNMLRTNRMWNALTVLHKAMAYNDGIVDPKKIKLGPGALIPVNGDPNDLLKEIEFGEIPFSSYREAQEIQADIERTSGISDSSSGADAGSQQTATGIQLVQAAANARIQNKTRRVEVEVIKPQARHWVCLNQRHILENRTIRVPAPPTPDEPERRWTWFKLGPNELMGEFDIEPEGGSTTPDNVPQKRQDAQIKLTMLGTPAAGILNPREFVLSILEDLGFKNPEAYLSTGQAIPPMALDLIVQQLGEMGMEPQMAQQLVAESVQAAFQMQDQQAQASNHGQQPGDAENARAAA